MNLVNYKLTYLAHRHS